MTLPSESPDPALRELVAAMKRKPRPLALLGAGTSVDSGYPDWSRLLEILEQRTHGKISPKYQAFLKTLNDAAWLAEEYRRVMGEHTFKSVIASEFAPKNRIGEVLRVIASLGFRHLLTTNYDSCIESAYEESGRNLQVVEWTEESNMRRFFLDLSKDGGDPYLVYLHGRYYDPGNIVLTESSYARRYVRSDDANRKLFAILITQPVVFIGFSVNDPDLNHLMREVNARLGVGNPQHFALMGYEVDEQKEFIKSRLEGKFGISPVFYPVTREGGVENHQALITLLRQLYHEVHEADGVTEQPPAPLRRSVEAPVAAAAWEPDSAARKPVEDPLDPQKGKWGGLAEAGGRRLRVRLESANEETGYCTFDLIVEPASPADPPVEGEVVFHLHPTFYHPVLHLEAEDGKAVCPLLQAYGAFTAGAEADGGQTRLELDLALVEDLPAWFRSR
ncbi:MAG TPA: SIR2 family protein [Longimicrobium sp.]|nr:SIR2 family protein [Longimicrobium sp.]